MKNKHFENMLIFEAKKSNLLLYYIESKGQEAIP